MTQELSSLMDGELAGPDAERAIQACCASDDAKAKWHLYHVIGDAMRGHAPRTLARPETTLQAIGTQPTVLAPRRTSPVTFTRVALAAAASVATVGVVGWIGSQGGPGSAVPVSAKTNSGIQPASNTVVVPAAAKVAIHRCCMPNATAYGKYRSNSARDSSRLSYFSIDRRYVRNARQRAADSAP